MTAPWDAGPLEATLLSAGALARPRSTVNPDTPPLVELAGLSFRETVAEALRRHDASQGAASDPEAAGAMEAGAPVSLPDTDRVRQSAQEAGVIAREAARTGVDPSLLSALRRTENGGMGREFGVLSVAAPDVEAQARVAANTIRNTQARFEQEGGTVVDAASGRYTEAFLRFFSSRYAPLGAQNDPAGLNRFHAANLIANYRKVIETKG